MSIFVIRHAKAGSRRAWVGDDRARPLSKGGRRQAAVIAERLRHETVRVLSSSPSQRCMDTLAPLGRRLGLEVVAEPRLGEGVPFETTLALLTELGDGAVMCSHGDVIPDLIGALVRRGTVLTTPPDWHKGALWVLAAPDAHGTIATAAAEPPPPDDSPES